MILNIKADAGKKERTISPAKKYPTVKTNQQGIKSNSKQAEADKNSLFNQMSNTYSNTSSMLGGTNVLQPPIPHMRKTSNQTASNKVSEPISPGTEQKYGLKSLIG